MPKDRPQRSVLEDGGRRWTARLAALCAAACTWLLLSTTALAERPALPSPIPNGYTVEKRGAVRWIYPTSATDEAAELMEAQPAAWRKLQSAFGSELSPELDIRIGIHPDDMRRLAGRPLPSYASGVAIVGEGLVLLSLTAPETWLRPDMQKLLVHELSHVALHRAVAGHTLPRWFTEGVSIHRAGERNIVRIRTLWQGAVQQRLIRLEQLSNAFPADHHSVDLAYAQSADLVRYMLDGRDERARFRELIGLLREGVAFETAVHRAYHVTLGYLEREWRNQIQRRYGRWPSVLVGLTGVWALAALLLVAGYIRTRHRHRRTLRQWAHQEAEQDRVEQDAATIQLPASAQALPQAQPLSIQVAEPAAREQEAPVSHVDRILDRALRDDGDDIPTVDHDGRNHTLH